MDQEACRDDRLAADECTSPRGRAAQLHKASPRGRRSRRVGSPGRTAALDIYRDLGDPLSQANGLNELADVRRLTGDLPAAGSGP
jgi:hypothetical protein